MKEFWNDRYAAKGFAYGKEPNEFFRQELDKLEKGKILLPADGEGRNSVYAALHGWDVYACDLSIKGKEKAGKLAHENGVHINYDLGDFGALSYKDLFFDTIALIYAHFLTDKKADYNKLGDRYLKVGGTIIFEAFSKNQLKYNSVNPSAGGPRDIEMLYSIEEIGSYFPNYEIKVLEASEITLNEGDYHIGQGSVVRFVGRKLH